MTDAERRELIDEAIDLLKQMKKNFLATSEVTLPQLYEILETLSDSELEDDLLEPIEEIDY
jgi:hypothetical protein